MKNTYTSNNRSKFIEPTIGNYFELLKPRVMSLAIFTALIGQLMANSQENIILVSISLLSIAIGAGAAGCINMWYERDIDLVMQRTKNRPIPAGKILADDALTFGVVLSVFSVLILTLSSNYLAGFLLISTILFYVFIYTVWLKKRTAYNIVIGGAAGALPPVIGWASVDGSLSALPLIMFLIIFLWTPPHFWALSLYNSDDYKRANLPMLPLVLGEKATRKQIVSYSFVLYLSTLIPFFLGIMGQLYAISAIILGSYFIYRAFRVFANDKDSEKKLFKYSIVYLFLLFVVMPIDKFFF